MSTFKVPAKEQVSLESQAIFDRIQKSVGKVPNLYAVIGYSSNALQAFLSFEDQLSKGIFTPLEREAVFIVVSEVNQCLYCLSAHTFIAEKKGLSNEEILNIRSGSASDAKLDVIIKLAKSVAERKGKADPDTLQRFLDAGFDNAAVLELVGLVVTKLFTNYVFALTEVPIDFPVVESLSESSSMISFSKQKSFNSEDYLA